MGRGGWQFDAGDGGPVFRLVSVVGAHKNHQRLSRLVADLEGPVGQAHHERADDLLLSIVSQGAGAVDPDVGGFVFDGVLGEDVDCEVADNGIQRDGAVASDGFVLSPSGEGGC